MIDDEVRTFSVLGKVKGKQRPKVAMRGGYAHAYTPPQTVDYETYIKQCYLDLHHDKEPMQGALRIVVSCYYRIPKSFSNIKRQEARIGNIAPIVKPDLDNVIKVICDALNTIAYHDDNQICQMSIEKHYEILEGMHIELRRY